LGTHLFPKLRFVGGVYSAPTAPQACEQTAAPKLETEFRGQVHSQTEFGNEPESLKLTGRAVRTIVGGRTVWM